MKFYWVYMMTNARHTVLYIGVTNDLERRSMEHQERVAPRSFTARYNADKLVWHEAHSSIEAAIAREKQLKNWKREWKDALINESNPTWRDLSVGGMMG